MMDGQRKGRAIMGGVAGGTCHEVIQQHLREKREREEGRRGRPVETGFRM